MNKRKRNILLVSAVSITLATALAGCGAVKDTSQASSMVAVEEATSAADSISTAANTSSSGAIDATDLFTERDLEQTADLTNATYYTVSDGQTISITEDGVYVISGTAANAQIVVEAADDAKVQLVLDGVSITNDSIPAIYVKSADKVFVTTTDSSNTLSVTGVFTEDGATNTDAVIFSKDDLVLNGLGTLTIDSTDNAITSKDDLKVTGGSYVISCTDTALEANDSVAIADGSFTFTNCDDGIHAENDEDDTVGYVYICGGTFDINAADDGIHGTTIVQIDDGSFDISAVEGIEATYVQINGGTIQIESSDDGINATTKSTALDVLIEINGGDITINMAQGDTDAIDSNGNLYINGGTINISAQSPFDYDGTAQKNGGTIIVNGTETDTISNQMMGGMRGGPQGGMPGDMGQGGNMGQGSMPGGGPQGGMGK